MDRLFWTALRRFWSRWSEVLVIVKPDTVAGWHRAGFRLYWRWRSRSRGRAENPGWGAPRIQGEIQTPGFAISERTVARYLRRIHRKGDPAKRWLAFPRNHRELIIAFDFFSVPTVTFRLLYCFFVIEHDRRRILHLQRRPSSDTDWIIQQLREALPEASEDSRNMAVPLSQLAALNPDESTNDAIGDSLLGIAGLPFSKILTTRTRLRSLAERTCCHDTFCSASCQADPSVVGTSDS